MYGLSKQPERNHGSPEDSHRGLSDCPGHTIEQSQSLPDQKIVWTIFRPACPG